MIHTVGQTAVDAGHIGIIGYSDAFLNILVRGINILARTVPRASIRSVAGHRCESSVLLVTGPRPSSPGGWLIESRPFEIRDTRRRGTAVCCKLSTHITTTGELEKSNAGVATTEGRFDSSPTVVAVSRFLPRNSLSRR